jgi:hypothetical protein
MKFAIVHLSDLHFRTKNDVGFKRMEKLANAIRFFKSPDEQLIFVISGDVANSGSADEYKVAEAFFKPLFIGLGIDAQREGLVNLIPGNHDCNFYDLSDLRPRLLSEIESQLDSIDSSGETVGTLLQVQQDFFIFHRTITGVDLPRSSRLYHTSRIQAGDHILEFRLFNSS